jgi:hypothetical protein
VIEGDVGVADLGVDRGELLEARRSHVIIRLPSFEVPSLEPRCPYVKGPPTVEPPEGPGLPPEIDPSKLTPKP